MKQKFFLWGGYAALTAVSLAFAFLTAQALFGSSTALAQGTLAGDLPNLPNIPDTSAFYCSMVNAVTSAEAGAHLHCRNPVISILIDAGAIEPVHHAAASQSLVVANTGFALNKGVWLYNNPSSGLEPPGWHGCLRDLEALHGLLHLQL